MTNTGKNKTSLKDVLWQAITNADSERTALQVLPDPDLESDGKRISYKELREEVGRLSEEFISKGIKGNRIGIIAERKTSVIIAFLACLISECPAVLLSPEEEKTEIYNKLVQTGCVMLFGDSGFRSGSVKETDTEGEAFLFFTSGTTGKEKCVIRTVENTLSAASAAAATMHHGRMQLLNIPLFHSNTINRFILPSLIRNCTMTLSRGPRTWYEEIRTLKPEELFVVPAQASLLFDLLKDAEKERPLSVRYIISTGASLPENTQKNFLSLGIRTLDVYGCSEVGLVANPYYIGGQYETRPGSVGKLMPDLTYMIGDPDPDGYGELLLKGPTVFPGYLNNEAETKSVLRDGWLHTGDLAKIDADGFLYLNGRVKNLIILESGENVSPEELEEIFGKTEGVKECLCFEYRNAITMEIVLDKEWFAAHLENGPEEFLRERTKEINAGLPTWKRVAAFYLRNEPLRKTATGKLKRTGIPAPEEDGCVLMKTSGRGKDEKGDLNPQEAVLSAFEEAFPGRNIDTDSDFFELGGDSLCAMSIAVRLGETGYPVSARELFSFPRVKDLIGHLLQTGTLRKESNDREVRKAEDLLRSYRGKIIAPGIPEDELQEIRDIFKGLTVEAVYTDLYSRFGSPIKEKAIMDTLYNHFFLDRLIFLKEPIDKEVFFDRMMTISKRHPALRSKYTETSGGWRMVILKELTVPAFYTDLSDDGRSDAEKVRGIIEEYKERLALKREDPLPDHLRVSCFKLSPGKCMILFEQTHLITDRWSTDLVLRELINGPETKEEDCFHLYRLWKSEYYSKGMKEAERFRVGFIKEIAGSETLAFDLTGKNKKVLTREETVVTRFDPALSASINEYCARERITPSELIGYAYYQALMEKAGIESAVFLEHFSGREEMPFDVRDCYDNFATIPPCYLRKTDTLRDYHERLARIAKYSQGRFIKLWEIFTYLTIGLNKILFDEAYFGKVTSEMDLEEPLPPDYRYNTIRIAFIRSSGKCYRIETHCFVDEEGLEQMEKISDRILEMAASLVSKGVLKDA